jgi:hypothetical protein
MKNTSQKGASTGATIIVVVIILILIGVIALALVAKKTEAPAIILPQTTNSTTTVTTTTNTSATSSPAQTTDETNTKTYTNTTFGFAVDYPKDFLLKNEGFSTTTGAWKAVLSSNRGEIDINVDKGSGTIQETKLQATSIKIGTKDAAMYNTRRDSCDASVAHTDLDANFMITFTFQSCGNQFSPIYKATDEIKSTLASVKFLNENSKIYLNTKLGLVFRYPITWSQPTVASTKTNTVINFGKDFTLTSGASYSTSLKRDLTYGELVANARVATSTVDTQVTVGGKEAHLIVTTPSVGPALRTVFVKNKNDTDTITLNQIGVDSQGLDLVIASFGYIK